MVARQYVITDAGWNLLDLASQLRSLTSLTSSSARCRSRATPPIDGQDSNVVNPAYIKSIVHATFYPHRRGTSLGRRSVHPRRPGTQPSMFSMAAIPLGSPGMSRPRWSRSGTAPARSATRATARHGRLLRRRRVRQRAHDRCAVRRHSGAKHISTRPPRRDPARNLGHGPGQHRCGPDVAITVAGTRDPHNRPAGRRGGARQPAFPA